MYRPALEDGAADAPTLMPRAWHGLPSRTRARFMVSGDDWKSWRREQSLRTGKIEISTLGGMAFGDVTRGYDIRVALNEPTPITQSGPIRITISWSAWICWCIWNQLRACLVVRPGTRWQFSSQRKIFKYWLGTVLKW